MKRSRFVESFKKLDLFFFNVKLNKENLFFFFKEENYIHEINLCYLHQHKTLLLMTFFFLFQNLLCLKKFRYASKEDTNQFLC